MNKKRLKIFLFSFFLLTSTLLFLPAKKIFAEKCDPGKNKDCHSLRPFPGEILYETNDPLAQICGNSIFITDSITAYSSPALILAGAANCDLVGGNYICHKEINRNFKLGINLEDTELPIMGNTEDVVNRVTMEDKFDDLKKVNEYVSWYLNGVNFRAEYPFPEVQTEEGKSKIVNLSGPINKLIPFDVQQSLRTTTVKRVEEAVEEKVEVPDQVVACRTWRITGGRVIRCYPSDQNTLLEKIQIQAARKVLLSDYDNILFPKRLPPERTDPRYLFWGFTEYLKAYKKWRGESCLKINFFGTQILLCFDLPLRANFWGNMFPYIPLSSTEDRKGSLSISYGGAESGGVDVANPELNEDDSTSELFFAHMIESNELADILKSTFLPSGINSEIGSDIIPPTLEYGCKSMETRDGEGDNLFADSPELKTKFSYTANFDCIFSEDEVKNAAKNLVLLLKCEKDVTIDFNVNTETPLADQVWEKLVAGTSSIFRRIFPKTGSNSPVYGIHDIPGSTEVSYSSTKNTSLADSGGLIYFPHIGGVGEYFLKAIQTALRPKGHGYGPISGQPIPNPSPSTEINCNQSAPTVSLPKTLSIDAMYNLALMWESGKTGNHVMECYNDVAGRALSAGMNPAFAFTIWLNESNASNYNVSVKDFGIVDSSIYRDFNKQIERFLGYLTAPIYTSCMTDPNYNSYTPTERFLWVFRTGKCLPSPEATKYADGIKDIFTWFAPGCSLPTTPSDMSCY